MKYKIPQDKLDKMVFRYLNLQYGDLEKHKGKYFGFVFKKPNTDYNDSIMKWTNPQSLYVDYSLVKEIIDVFSLTSLDAKSAIGRWVENKFNIEVKLTWTSK